MCALTASPKDEMPEVDKEGFAKLEATVADLKDEQAEIMVRTSMHLPTHPTEGNGVGR